MSTDRSGDKSKPLDPSLLRASITAQDIQDSLVEQSLSETILLQNVTFDPNLFDGLNLDLESHNGPAGSTSLNATNEELDLGLESDQSLEQLNLLDSIELQILKEVQSSSGSVPGSMSHAMLGSSDPLVSSTTTIYAYDKLDQTEESNSSDFKYFDKLAASGGQKPLQVKLEPSDATSEEVPTDSLSQGALLDNKVTNATSKVRNFAGEKVFLTTGPIASKVTALSLANMKVVGQNVVAIISDQENECKRQSLSRGGPPPQTRLIIIEDKKTPVPVGAVPAVSYVAGSKETKTLSKTSESHKSATKSGTAVKEAKGTANVASSTGASGDSSQFTDADSNSGTPSSKQFVPCKVCGDKASGYHYGVTSCEGCKGFFRRSIQKQIEYRCLRDGKCLIIRLNRNRCQYCRFKKCLAVGMSRDSVRYGRVPKKNKEKERMEEKANGVTQAEADQSSVVDVDSKDLALYDTILTISQAHHANCSYTDDKVKGLSKKPIFVITNQVKLEPSDECSSSPDVGSVSESLEAQKIELWEQLALLITPCIQRVVEFAKRIPGFSDLTQDDQLILIKLGFFEVWLVHISKTADFVDNTLTFADGAFLSRKQLELMFDHEFMGNLFHLMSGLNSLTLNDTEIGLFSAIILLQSDRPQIYDIKAINKIQENVVEALKVQIGRNHSDDAQTFQKLMLKINELRALGSSHSLHLQWFRSNWLRLKLPPLFAEIFDIPKGNSFLNAVQPSSAVSQCMQSRDQQPPGATSNTSNAQTLAQTSLANSSLASPIENSNH